MAGEGQASQIKQGGGSFAPPCQENTPVWVRGSQGQEVSPLFPNKPRLLLGRARWRSLRLHGWERSPKASPTVPPSRHCGGLLLAGMLLRPAMVDVTDWLRVSMVSKYCFTYIMRSGLVERKLLAAFPALRALLCTARNEHETSGQTDSQPAGPPLPATALIAEHAAHVVLARRAWDAYDVHLSLSHSSIGQPGATASVLASAHKRLGFCIPPRSLAVWLVRDGWMGDTAAGSQLLGFGGRFLPLTEAVQVTQALARQRHISHLAVTSDAGGQRLWLGVASGILLGPSKGGWDSGWWGHLQAPSLLHLLCAMA